VPVPATCRLIATAVLAITPAVTAAGCGPDREGPTPEQQVRAVVARFGLASRQKDYQTICDDLLADALVQRVEAIGLPCETALQRGLADVRDPRLVIRQVSMRGARALVRVHSTAAGQPPSDDAIELVRENGAWRIASLAAPGGSSATAPASTTAPPATTTAPRTTTSAQRTTTSKTDTTTSKKR
jgi:hypothetical protein